MIEDRTLQLIVRLLEECLEEEYTSEELRSKAQDMLKLLDGGVISDQPERAVNREQ